jgi:hypothetical protein
LKDASGTAAKDTISIGSGDREAERTAWGWRFTKPHGSCNTRDSFRRGSFTVCNTALKPAFGHKKEQSELLRAVKRIGERFLPDYFRRKIKAKRKPISVNNY